MCFQILEYETSSSQKTKLQKTIEYNKKLLCKACGLSLFKSEREADMATGKGKTKGFNIYGVFLACDMGIIKRTPSTPNPSHHTWYPYKDINLLTCFKAIEEIKNGN